MSGTENSGPPAPESPDPKPDTTPILVRSVCSRQPRTGAVDLRSAWRHENVHAGADDHQRNDDGERQRIDRRRRRSARVTERCSPEAHGRRDAPFDGTAAPEQPGAEDPGKQEREERGRRGLVDAQPAVEREVGHHQHAAYPNRPDEYPDHRRHRGEQEISGTLLQPGAAQPAAKATSSLVSSAASCFIERIAESRFGIHQGAELRTVDREHLAVGEAVCGGDAVRMPFDQRSPSEYVAAPDDLAGGSLALSQTEGEADHAVGKHVEIVHRIADHVDARIPGKGAPFRERANALELLGSQAGKKACLREYAGFGDRHVASRERHADISPDEVIASNPPFP